MQEVVAALYGCRKVYGPYLGQDGRKRCVLYFSKGKTKSQAYARLLIEARLGRLLDADEHVDHIDGDCTNDAIENLQVLKMSDHRIKSGIEMSERLDRSLVLQCPVCSGIFKCQRSRAELTETPCCTQKCAKRFKWRNQYAEGGALAEGGGVEPPRRC